MDEMFCNICHGKFKPTKHGIYVITMSNEMRTEQQNLNGMCAWCGNSMRDMIHSIWADYCVIRRTPEKDKEFADAQNKGYGWFG